MNFGLFCDSSSVASYKADGGKIKTLDGKPYYRGANIKDECAFGFWNYPVAMDGYFINMRNTELPDVRFDVIFAAIERDFRNFEIIRKKYPSAKILLTIKELYIANFDIRRQLAAVADGLVMPYLNLGCTTVFGVDCPNVHKIPQPVNLEYLRENYMVGKRKAIFNYSNFWATGRQADNRRLTDSFPDVPVVGGRTDPTSPTYQEDFIHMWNGCQFMANLDPTLNYGLQAIQCAALGVIVVGGNNDAHRTLFPDLAHMDVRRLTEQLTIMLTVESYVTEIVNYARVMADAVYSLHHVRSMINKLI